MKSISSALSAALGAPVQRPAVLVEMAFDPVRRWSSFASITWAGHDWQQQDVSVEDLQVGALSLTGTLRLGNLDGAAAALVMAQGAQDRAVRLWGYDAAATGGSDVVWLADAVCGALQIGMDAVTLELRHPCELMLSPRTFIGAGFGPQLPAGTVLKINGQAYTLARRA